MDQKKSKPRSCYRHYCCVCRNYRGKLVDSKNVTLHRFPSNVVVRTAWLNRIKVLRQHFKLNLRNDRLCSAHFKDGVFVKDAVPSVFILDNGRVKTFATTRTTATVEHEDLPLTEVDPTSDRFEFETLDLDESEVRTFVSDLSSEYASVMLHDYCGPVSSNFTHNLNKNEQTCTFPVHATQIPPIPKMTSISTQTCSIPVVNITELAKSGIMRKDVKSIGIQAVGPDLEMEDIVDSNERCVLYRTT